MSSPVFKTFIPDSYQHRPGEAVDLLINFKGDPQIIWNNAKYARLNTVILTINYDGLSSTYETPFINNPALFQNLLDEALSKVRSQPDFADDLQWSKVGVSSFSAGWASLRQILKTPAYVDRIDAMLMADSIYAGLANDGTAIDSQMAVFKAYASLAAAGTKTFILDHSREPVPYASTTVCADEILAHLGLTAEPVDIDALGPLHLYRHAKLGNFELWGESGDTDAEHWNHLYYMGQFLKDLPLAKISEFESDFNGDGWVNAADLAAWSAAPAAGDAADANGDGRSAGEDFLAWQRQVGSAPAAAMLAGQVPEPTPRFLAAALALGMRAGSRRWRF